MDPNRHRLKSRRYHAHAMACPPKPLPETADHDTPAQAQPPEALFAHSATEGVLLSLAKVVEQRDSHTAGHCERLAFTAVAIGVAMRLESRDLLTLYLGGYLHDVGKVGIPDSILFKPGKLSDSEWETMRTHPVRGE